MESESERKRERKRKRKRERESEREKGVTELHFEIFHLNFSHGFFDESAAKFFLGGNFDGDHCSHRCFLIMRLISHLLLNYGYSFYFVFYSLREFIRVRYEVRNCVRCALIWPLFALLLYRNLITPASRDIHHSFILHIPRRSQFDGGSIFVGLNKLYFISRFSPLDVPLTSS